MSLNNSNIDRFFNKVNFTSTCWNWVGGKTNFGHGRFKIDKKFYSPHRLSYEYFYTNIPPKMLVCHHCDNPSCVNPGHLFLGSYSDNMKDCTAKGRVYVVPKDKRAFGENNGSSKFTNTEVKLLRELYPTFNMIQLAKMFKVNKSTISDIINKHTYRLV